MRATQEEEQWRRARQELYAKLNEGGHQPLNKEAVLSSRALFTEGEEFQPREFDLPSEDDAVSLVAGVVPSDAAEMIHDVAQEIIDLLPRDQGTGKATGYVSKLEQMHVTLFHTSHPDELSPGAKARQPQDIAQVRVMARRFLPFQVLPKRVILAASGAMILVYDCLPATPEQLEACGVVVKEGDDIANQNAEFSVDHIRRVAQETFKHMPKSKGTRTIIHSTLARVLSPDVRDDTLKTLRDRCDEISERFEREPKPFLVSNLWFVEETHFIAAIGVRTVIPLGPRA